MARSEEEYDYILPPSNLESIDGAVLRYVKDEMALFSSRFDGWRKVPVLWVAPERSYQRKKNKDLRDDDGTLILPLITIERTGIVKDPVRKGAMGIHMPQVRDRMRNQFTIGKVINQTKTARQTNAATARRKGAISGPEVGRGQRNMKNWSKHPSTTVVYDMITVPVPVYVDCNYTISIRAGYQQQINELVQPFLVKSGQKSDFRIQASDHHSYVSHFEADLTPNNNISTMENEERVYETQLKMIVNGYFLGEGPNQPQPHVVRRQTAVKAVYGRERVVLGDINEWMEEDDLRGLFSEQFDTHADDK